MTQDEIIEMARHCGYWNGQTCEMNDVGLEAFAKLVAAKEREHWKEIVGSQLRCITALNDIVGGKGSTTTKNILDYSRMEERIKEAVDKEREACAKICGEYNFGQAPKMIQDAIRARVQADRGEA